MSLAVDLGLSVRGALKTFKGKKIGRFSHNLKSMHVIAKRFTKDVE